MSGANMNGNREKQEKLKGIIKELHDGVPAEKLQKKFRAVIKDTSPEEIADMENALIQEGFPVEEVQRLCDVHAQVFEKALSTVGKPKKMPGHPLYTFIQENKETKKILKRLLRSAKRMAKASAPDADTAGLENEFALLKEIEKHYLRKENQLFPVLEEKKFMGPSKVMWGKHDEIREKIKKAEAHLRDKDWPGFYDQIKDAASAIKKMIFLEEKILYPTSARKLTTLDWANIKKGENEIGYAWVTPSNLWDAELAKSLEGEIEVPEDATGDAQEEDGKIRSRKGR